MIDELTAYPEYRESGLPWLGRVPAHWDVRRLKSAVRNVVEPTSELRAGEAYIALEHVEGWTGRTFPKQGENLFTGQTKRFRIDDILFGKLRPYLAKVTRTRGSGACSAEFFVLRPIDSAISSAYLEHEVRSKPFIEVINGSTFGAKMPRADWQYCGNISIALPPPAEQAAIVRFLDWANGRLERAMRAKRRIITLLNEQKQAIILRAVTRGLDPNVKLKDSGIPWLGEIPEHWDVRRFKFLANISSGQVDPRRIENRDQVLVAPNHIESGSGRLLTRVTASEQGADSGKYIVKKGQIVYSKIRPHLRKAIIAPCDCLCSADMYPIEPRSAEISSEFMLLLLLSEPFTKFAVDSSMRVAMPKVNREFLEDCVLWYPTHSEQTHIIEYLAQTNHPIETTISRLEREIGLLREYRTRLVADVVTGKLDVRAAVARLPPEAELDSGSDEVDLEETSSSTDEELDLP